MKRYFALLSTILAVNLALGQVNLTQKQIAKLDSIAKQDVPAEAPGIATAIVSEGKLVYQYYAGLENLEDSLKINNNSRFNIASNGKQFTALAILLLEDQGKLNLNDDIREYLPEVYSRVDARITIQDLLNHTSGIRDVYDLWSLQGIIWWQQTYDNQDVLNLIRKQKGLNFPPGSDYLYSNTNYILLAEIIERVSNQTFVDFTNDIFAKLNMHDTSFEDNFTAIQGPIAKPYFNFDTWSNYEWKWNVVGDGNCFSTSSDQIKWEKIVQGFGHPKIARNVIRRSQERDPKYGYGLEFGEYKALPYRFHEGATGAWKATVARFEKQNLSIFTMTNSGKTIPSMQTRQMIDVIFDLNASTDDLITKPEKTGKFVSEDEILGVYLASGGFSFEFKKNEAGNLVLNRIGRGEVELVREADNIFQQKFDPAFKQEFARNQNGEMVVTAYYTSHAPYSLTRANADWNSFNYAMLNGTFVNGETGVEMMLEHDTIKNYQVFINDQKNTGKLVTPTQLLVNNYLIEFQKNNTQVSSFFLSADRIKNVQFERKL